MCNPTRQFFKRTLCISYGIVLYRLMLASGTVECEDEKTAHYKIMVSDDDDDGWHCRHCRTVGGASVNYRTLGTSVLQRQERHVGLYSTGMER